MSYAARHALPWTWRTKRADKTSSSLPGRHLNDLAEEMTEEALDEVTAVEEPEVIDLRTEQGAAYLHARLGQVHLVEDRGAHASVRHAQTGIFSQVPVRELSPVPPQRKG